jgi:hypothetical protein
VGKCERLHRTLVVDQRAKWFERLCGEEPHANTRGEGEFIFLVSFFYLLVVGLTDHPSLRLHTPGRHRGVKRRCYPGALFGILSPRTLGSNLDPPVVLGGVRYEFRGFTTELARTFMSYRPTRWSAETDRAIERSNAIAVAMTAARCILRKKSVIAK